MKENKTEQSRLRRGFLQKLGAGAAAIGLATVASAFKSAAPNSKESVDVPDGPKDPADLWFNDIKGKHRVVYDATRPHEVFPFAWPAVFLMTNAATGTPAEDCSVVVVLRHEAIPYAFKDKMWEKYHFADVFKAGDPGPAFQAADAKTAAKTRNPFWNTKPGDFAVPGIGPVPIGIKELQASGVKFCVCHAAMTVYTAALAGQMGLKAEDVMKEWTGELIPGIQVVPSGVWALGRAQEHGCKYIFAG